MTTNFQLTSQTLHQFVIGLDHNEIQTMDALLVQMTGDYAASRMIARILYWRDKAIKLGGWVWKSWRDWRAECGLSQGQVKRVHRDGVLEAYGMERSLMKANGAPTTHYLLDENKFIARLADFLNMAVGEVQSRLSSVARGEKSVPKSKKKLVIENTVHDFTQSDEKSLSPESLPIQIPSIYDRINEKTDLSHQQLSQFDKEALTKTWQEIQSTVRPMFLEAYGKRLNDLILHAFMGIPVSNVLREMDRRSKGHSTEDKPHFEYQVWLDALLEKPDN
jgi:hypothetical protein